MLNFNLSGVEIERLVDRRDKYAVYPGCQRQYVWKKVMKEKLIDSILRGLPIPPIVVMVERTVFTGERYLVVDGQQRLETIRKFVNGEFPTSKGFADETLLKPICPGLSFNQLPPDIQTDFLNYNIQMCFIRDVPGNDLEACFRRMNNQVPLTLAEKLHSYSSSPNRKFLEEIAEHDFWKTVYQGPSDRWQIYQASIIVMMLETYDGYCNLTTPRLVDAAAGSLGQTINQATINSAKKRLDLAQHIFKGASITAMGHIIPVYQAVYFLENDGYKLNKLDDGTLTKWWNQIYLDALEDQKSGYRDLFAVLQKTGEQQAFWNKHLSNLYDCASGCAVDKQRGFTEIQKLQAWLRQDGKCAICGNRVNARGVDGHHIRPHSNGGPTESDNCALVHKKCHEDIHSQLSKESLQIVLLPDYQPAA